jgi:hypothetical protein
VADIFQEVDEEVRRERFRQLWSRYANYIIAGMVVLVLGIGGYRAYQWYEAKQAAQSGAAFEAATALIAEGKTAEAEAALSRIAAEGNAGYRALALLREAAAVADRDRAAAVKIYDSLAADGSVSALLQDLARVRAGLLLMDAASYAGLRSRLEAATAANRPFRHTARELLAFSAWRAGDAVAAKQWADMIIADAATPAATRQRVDVLLAVSNPVAKS